MVSITKSYLDDRDYRSLVLPNQLEVLLVHDPTVDMGAASISVGVGSYEDPDDLPGLAHFLEHLLFMGTKKYPEESEYGQFLNEHAGRSNAYTSAEHTNYHFDVAWPHLRDALDRFAQFFIEPLFAEETKTREIMAVNSENKRNLQNDIWRFFQLKKSLSNSDHPISKFSTGNYDTLGRIPEEKGIDVRERLIKFYKEHYTAAIMKLVIIGRQPLDTLEEYARECFTEVPNNHPELKDKPSWYRHIPPLRHEDLGMLIKAKPVMDINMVSLTFPIPDQQPLCDTSPYFYYLDLLGHESKGSLLYFLKEKRWATEVSALISHICSGSDHLYCNIELTNEGLKHWRDVIAAAFGYIEMLKKEGPQKQFFEEQKKISEASFIYRQKSRSMHLATALAQVMHRPIPRERLLNYSVLKYYDEEQLKEFVNFLSLDNVQVLISSPNFEDLDKREFWYGTEYSYGSLGSVKPLITPEFHMPHANDFLTTNFELVKEANGGPASKQMRPRLLENTPELRLWHKLDDQFRVPKAHIFCKIIHSCISDSPRHIRIADLFTSMINDALNDVAYYADLADVSMALVTVQDGLEIEVYGFSEKLDKLLEVIIDSLCYEKLEEQRFDVIKEQQKRDLANLALAQPEAQRTIQTGYLLLEKLYPLNERLNALDEITFADLVEYTEKVRATVLGLEILVCGNRTSEQARTTAKTVRSMMDRQRPPGHGLAQENSTEYEHNTSFLNPVGSNQFRQVSLADPDNVNSALFLAMQFGEADLELSASLSIISHLLKEATYEQLRTKEQLGYLVVSAKSQSRSTLYLNFFVQSEQSTEFVESRVENYIQNVAWPLISQMSETEYKNNISALRAELLEASKNLTEESFRFWGAISSGYYDFYRRQKLAQIASTQTKEHIAAVFERLVKNPKTRTRFALHLQSQKRKCPEPELVLARTVGQLATERRVKVTQPEILKFMSECRSLAPSEALAKLSSILVNEKEFSSAEAKDFVDTSMVRMQEALTQHAQNDMRPTGDEIKSLPEYYANVKLASRATPVEPLETFMTYEESPKL